MKYQRGVRGIRLQRKNQEMRCQLFSQSIILPVAQWCTFACSLCILVWMGLPFKIRQANGAVGIHFVSHGHWASLRPQAGAESPELDSGSDAAEAVRDASQQVQWSRSPPQNGAPTAAKAILAPNGGRFQPKEASVRPWEDSIGTPHNHSEEGNRRTRRTARPQRWHFSHLCKIKTPVEDISQRIPQTIHPKNTRFTWDSSKSARTSDFLAGSRACLNGCCYRPRRSP